MPDTIHVPDGVVIKTYDEVHATRLHYIDIYKPIAGWKCKCMGWYPVNDSEPDGEQMLDCAQTGFFGHADIKGAVIEGLMWAQAEELPFVMPAGVDYVMP